LKKQEEGEDTAIYVENNETIGTIFCFTFTDYKSITRVLGLLGRRLGRVNWLIGGLTIA